MSVYQQSPIFFEGPQEPVYASREVGERNPDFATVSLVIVGLADTTLKVVEAQIVRVSGDKVSSVGRKR